MGLGLALDLERSVTEQFSRLAGTARDEGDYLGEQFVQGSSGSRSKRSR